MTIRVLNPELAAQISAGEVVERPVSVVKELVENSIDAGATRITIEIKGGGVERIGVTDNGCGIPADEVAVAFKRHATSKLATPEQLDAIATLGFRGEALPSIASVSETSLVSRPPGASLGYRIRLRWGEKIDEGAQGTAPGTSVIVGDLFGNLPARRKFLRSNSAEAARIHELLSRYALANPHISFELITENRTTLSTPGSNRPAEALLAVYGREAASGMLEIAGDDSAEGYGVSGFVSAPGLTRANRTYMSFFVNHRWIQNRMLSFAAEEAYHGLLPDKRYPLAVLDLEIPYNEVDVNSHPAKREVRFHFDRKVYASVQRAVRATLMAESPVPTMTSTTTRGSGVPSGSGFFRSNFPGTSAPASPPAGPQWNAPTGPPDAAATFQQTLPSLRAVGQVRLTYIVADGPDGMYLIDQHAAHERVLFDRIRRRATEKSPESQPLLSPLPVELTPSQAEILEHSSAKLASYGFEVENFGERSYLVRAVPAIMTTQDPAQSLVDVLDLVAVEGLLRQHEDVLAASIACHSAIRAGKSLTDAEMTALLEQLEATDNPHTCPHGRPTLMHFSEYQMERGFGRR
jgi:DNA mismatch repair protein MutL